MLDLNTAPLVEEIINLFAKYKLPIIAREKVFDDVRLIMESRIVEPVDDIRMIVNLDSLRRKNAVYQCCRRNQYRNE